jgi:hypothetical protein
MVDHRSLLQEIIRRIEEVSIADQEKYPELQKLIPELYKAIQIEDECDHKFINGVCICGFTQKQE